MSKNLNISQKSNIFNLNPIFDSSINCIRLSCRLKNVDINYESKHPVILHPDSICSTLLIRDRHEKSLHGGFQLTVSCLRELYWITNERRTVKFQINSCVTCVRFKGTMILQRMGNLRSPRVNPSFPFSHVGID